MNLWLSVMVIQFREVRSHIADDPGNGSLGCMNDDALSFGYGGIHTA